MSKRLRKAFTQSSPVRQVPRTRLRGPAPVWSVVHFVSATLSWELPRSGAQTTNCSRPLVWLQLQLSPRVSKIRYNNARHELRDCLSVRFAAQHVGHHLRASVWATAGTRELRVGRSGSGKTRTAAGPDETSRKIHTSASKWVGCALRHVRWALFFFLNRK